MRLAAEREWLRAWWNLPKTLRELEQQLSDAIVAAESAEKASKKALSASELVASKLGFILEDTEYSDRLDRSMVGRDPALGPLNRGR